MIVLKFSSVEHSTCIRAGRSARAQITAELAETSPGLNAAGDQRPIGGAAEVGSGEAADTGNRSMSRRSGPAIDAG